MGRALCWLRRDLRLEDQHALAKALDSHDEVFLCFIFDSQILEKLKDRDDQRLGFIWQSLEDIETQLQVHGSGLHLRYGDPAHEVPKLALELKVDAVYFNRDYEAYAKMRDRKVVRELEFHSIAAHSFKDQVMFESQDCLNKQGEAYKVYGAFRKQWLEKLYAQEAQIPDYRCHLKKLGKVNRSSDLKKDWFKLMQMEFRAPYLNGGATAGQEMLKSFMARKVNHYDETRDFPAKEGTSHLGVHLRHGTLSVRDCIRATLKHETTGAQIWLNELIWREFFMAILDYFPYVEQGAFRAQYQHVPWENNERHFKAWCEGQTGFPIVDAAMRDLKTNGMIPNRLRMVVANFLCKLLLTDWRKGERHFARYLLDYDLAANNGNWQWCASTGTDAEPYFRIFNPYNQSEKFDSAGEYIRSFCPELAGFSADDIHAPHLCSDEAQMLAGCIVGKDYPEPIIDYQARRAQALKMYQAVKS